MCRKHMAYSLPLTIFKGTENPSENTLLNVPGVDLRGVPGLAGGPWSIKVGRQAAMIWGVISGQSANP